jgi:hypothetical protein
MSSHFASLNPQPVNHLLEQEIQHPQLWHDCGQINADACACCVHACIITLLAL